MFLSKDRYFTEISGTICIALIHTSTATVYTTKHMQITVISIARTSRCLQNVERNTNHHRPDVYLVSDQSHPRT
jgi:hypothetical protein